MYSTSDLKKGLIIELDGAPHVVESVKISSPTARGGNTISRVRLRNLKTKQKVDKSFRGSESFADPAFEKRDCQLLYREQDTFHFMDQMTFEQFFFEKDDIEWEANFLRDELEGIRALIYNDEVIGLELPSHVTLKIAETQPSIKGASATARTKPATLETGHVVQVPEHIGPDDVLNVDTRTGEFLGRAN